jgi:hypothetical protein
MPEGATQITSFKKKLAEHQEAQHLRSVMLDRNTLTSSPIQNKKVVAQGSATESGVERSCSGTYNFPFQKPRSDNRKCVQKKLDFGAVHQTSQAVPSVESSSIPHTHVRNI